MKKWFAKYWKSVLFNLGETAFIFLSGWWLLSSWEHAAIVMGSFLATKLILGKGLHYKNWKLCMIWSYIVFLSLFFVAKVNFPIALTLSVFCSIILTQHANIDEMYQFAWSKERKHQEILDYVRRNDSNNPVIIELEKLINAHTDNGVKIVYKFIWLENQPFKVVQEMLDCDSYTVSRLSDVVANLFAKASVIELSKEK